MSLVQKHYIQDGEDYFVTPMTTEELLAAISVSSNGDIHMAGRRIAELADQIESLSAENSRLLGIIEDAIHCIDAHKSPSRQALASASTRHADG